MTAAPDSALRFGCEGDSLVGVLSMPAGAARRLGVVVVVGGPQYRGGSHRQFVLLARRLAAAGYPVLRFDSRGMGDSSGDFPGFDQLGPDLAAAVGALRTAAAGVDQVVLWGLCDAASAALLDASHIPGLAGLVLLNPWVRHLDTQARTEIRHYYAKRLFEAAFWRKLASGRVRVVASAGELSTRLWRMGRARLRQQSARRQADGAAEPADFRERMARGALAFSGQQLYVLSGRDHVCAEFVDYAGSHTAWSAMWSRPGVQRLDLPAADHTFSNARLRAAVEDATLAFLDRLSIADPG